MSRITEWLEFALAQHAAESYLHDEGRRQSLLFDPQSDAALDPRLVLGANHFRFVEQNDAADVARSTTQLPRELLKMFNERWLIVAHRPNSASGLSATLLKNRITNEFTISFRSAEAKDADQGGDVERDSSRGANGRIGSTGFALAQNFRCAGISE